LKKNSHDSSKTESSEDDSDISVIESGESDLDVVYPSSVYSRYQQEVRRLKERNANKMREKELVDSFSNIAADTTHLMAIKDIKVEVDMVVPILKSQLRVIREFAAAIPEDMKGTAYIKSLWRMLERGEKKLPWLNAMSEESYALETAVEYLDFGEVL
jgi:hypothetical protein